jgi:tetratricopeptide (TPR) repeat protein
MVIGVNPQDPGALNGLGNIYYEQGDFDNAIKETQLATSFAPTYTFAWYDLVIALQQKYVHGGQSRNEAAQTLLSLITALDKLNDLGQNPNAQKLPPAASQQMSDLVTWATAEANKYKQDSPEK